MDEATARTTVDHHKNHACNTATARNSSIASIMGSLTLGNFENDGFPEEHDIRDQLDANMRYQFNPRKQALHRNVADRGQLSSRKN